VSKFPAMKQKNQFKKLFTHIVLTIITLFAVYLMFHQIDIEHIRNNYHKTLFSNKSNPSGKCSGAYFSPNQNHSSIPIEIPISEGVGSFRKLY
jgi:hypothetical protein